MNDKYYYESFGYVLRSEFELPELSRRSPSQSYDIGVKFGEIDDSKVYDHECVRYIIKNGDFVVSRDSRPIDERARHYLLGVGMAELLSQRGDIVINSSSVSDSDGSILIIGESDVGKSSIACALLSFGYKLLSDSITKLSFNDGHVCAVPGFPCLKIEDTDVGEIVDPERKMSDSINHYRQYYNFEDMYCSEVKRLKHLFIITKGEKKKVKKMGGISDIRPFMWKKDVDSSGVSDLQHVTGVYRITRLDTMEPIDTAKIIHRVNKNASIH